MAVFGDLSACANCGSSGGSLQTCSRCRSQAYCGAECQRSHYKRHKSACRKAGSTSSVTARDNTSIASNPKNSSKKKITWCSPTTADPYVVTCPPGPLGLTIKKFAGEWIVVNSIYDMYSDHPLRKVGVTDIITTIDSKAIESEDDIPITCTKNTEIGVGERVMGMDAAAHSKGVLLAMKYIDSGMFHTLDYSNVAERYGEEFLEELNPHRKTSNQLFAEAWAELSKH